MPVHRSAWDTLVDGTPRAAHLAVATPLRGPLTVDVAVVGAGITGITVALLLAERGLRVAVVEAHVRGSGVTGGTSAHITAAIDTRYASIEKSFGKAAAAVVAESNMAAIALIEKHAREGTSCDFARVPAWLYAESSGSDQTDDQALSSLHEEYEAAKRAGLDVEMTRDVPLPFPCVAGVRFDHQGRFHPLAYVDGLAARAQARGVLLFEATRVLSVDDGSPCRLATSSVLGHGEITANAVILATHVPLNRVMLSTKVAPYRSYLAAFPFGGTLPDALFFDTSDPYHYVRLARLGSELLLLVGGEDHHTGSDDATPERFEHLEAYARPRFGVESPTFVWSAQVQESADGLPLIGRNPLGKNVFVATGYSGNGMTFGTVAAILLCDLVASCDNNWAPVYDSTRSKPLASASAFFHEAAHAAAHFAVDRVRPTTRHAADLRRGEGGIVKGTGRLFGKAKVAAYRDQNGKLHAFSPVCSHLGCHVHWNETESTWDCPCHGSRFDPTDGSVLDGPARRGLTETPGAERDDSGDESQS